MKSISTTSELKDYLQILEAEQQARGEELRMQFFITYREFKPYSLLANVVKKALPSSADMKDNILIGGLSLVSGLLVKKIVVGRSGGLVRKIAGTALQAGTTSLLVQNADTIKTIGQFLFGLLTAKKKKKKK